MIKTRAQPPKSHLQLSHRWIYRKYIFHMAAILFLSIKKFPQGWQTGMSWILDIDMLKYPKHQKHFVWTPMQRPVLCCRTTGEGVRCIRKLFWKIDSRAPKIKDYTCENKCSIYVEQLEFWNLDIGICFCSGFTIMLKWMCNFEIVKIPLQSINSDLVILV